MTTDGVNELTRIELEDLADPSKLVWDIFDHLPIRGLYHLVAAVEASNQPTMLMVSIPVPNL